VSAAIAAAGRGGAPAPALLAAPAWLLALAGCLLAAIVAVEMRRVWRRLR
jgi:hypothetical protein